MGRGNHCTMRRVVFEFKMSGERLGSFARDKLTSKLLIGMT